MSESLPIKPERIQHIKARALPYQLESLTDKGRERHYRDVGQVCDYALHLQSRCAKLEASRDDWRSRKIEQGKELAKIRAENAALRDFGRFVAELYCELDKLRYTTAQMPSWEIAEFMISRWPVLQGTQNQINLLRISEQEYNKGNIGKAVELLLPPHEPAQSEGE